MASVNIALLRQTIDTHLDKAIYPTVKRRLETQFKEAKQEMLEEFENHPVSQEIAAGPDLQNSLFLPKGNLFAFFGFYDNEKPVDQVKDILNAETKIKSVEKSAGKDKYTVILRAEVPTYQSLKERTELDIAGINKSWLEAVETGLLGLPQFIFGLFHNNNSKSGTGLEVKNNVRTSNFNGIGLNYMSKILRQFKDNIRGTDTANSSKVPKKFFSS